MNMVSGPDSDFGTASEVALRRSAVAVLLVSQLRQQHRDLNGKL